MYKVCGCCGKRFYIGWEVDLGTYLYKSRVGNDKVELYCGYTCWRKKVTTPKRRYKGL